MIEISRVTFSYGKKVVIEDFSLDIGKSEIIAIAGPSGAGKTTLLSLIAGFMAPGSGEIRIDGSVASDKRIRIRPARREIGFVSQGLALWPHMTVEEHLKFALKGTGLDGEALARRIAEVTGELGISALARKLPSQLSAGEAQRLAIARAMVTKPKILLLDEATANIDLKLRSAVIRQIRRYSESFRPAIVHVTHNIGEAFQLAGRIAVIENGRLLQVGAPQDVYEKPLTENVALLTGYSNIVPGAVEGGLFKCALGSFRIVDGSPQGAQACIRPHQVALRPDVGGDATVGCSTYQFGRWLVTANVRELSILAYSAEPLPAGSRVAVEISQPVWTFPPNA